MAVITGAVWAGLGAASGHSRKAWTAPREGRFGLKRYLPVHGEAAV